MKTTKTILILVALFLQVANTCKAQSKTFGIQTTVNGASIRTINNPDLSTATLLTLGINGYMQLRGNKNTGVSIEPGIMQKGGFKNKMRLQLTYLSLPVLVDIHLNDKIKIGAGLEMSYLLSAKQSGLHIKHLYTNLLEISALIGATYNAHENIDLGFRFGYGLTPTRISTVSDENANIIGESKEFNIYPLQFIFRYKI